MQSSRHTTAYSIDIQKFALLQTLVSDDSDPSAKPAVLKPLIFALQNQEPVSTQAILTAA